MASSKTRCGSPHNRHTGFPSGRRPYKTWGLPLNPPDPAFDKAPGVQSARFLGHDTSYENKNRYIVNHIKETDPRSARYVCSIALAIPNQKTIVFTETMEGEIAREPHGENGFGYDPIFYFPPLQKTTAELSPEQKHVHSHRGKALRKMETYLKELMKNG